MLTGTGFGKDSDDVRVNFGANVVEVYPPPLFAVNGVLATVPLIPPKQLAVSFSVAGKRSNEVAFRVTRAPALPETPGALTLKYLSMLDALAVLVSAEIRIADFGRFARRDFQNELADEVLNARAGLLVARERLLNAEDMGADTIAISEITDPQIQQLVARMGARVAVRAKTLFDQNVAGSQVIPQLKLAMMRIREGGITTATKTLEIVSESLNLAGDVAAAAESAAQSLALSAEAGIAIASGDVINNPVVAVAAAAYGLAKAIANGARIAAILSRNADQDRQDQEELEFRRKIEAKLDRTESKLDKTEGKLEQIESKADRSESKLDRAEQKLDQGEMKQDKVEVKLDRVELKLDISEIKEDRLEAKLDRVEPKLDRVEAKLDRQEKKLDKLEGKSDRAEGKLDRLEGKADKGEQKLDRLEGKSDKAEVKLEKLESKADKAETKLDKLEGKSDKAEVKLDKLEGKADRAEMKLDKLEGKSDKVETKLDKLEGKIDKTEIKLDYLQIQAQRDKEFWQFSPESWSVTNAQAVGVRAQGAPPPSGGLGVAFSVESIQFPAAGFKPVRLIVDGIATDLSPQGVFTPCNLLLSIGLVVIGASNSVSVEFETPYSGPVEFNGEKPQGLKLCTVASGPGSSQNSPNPCQN
jgi:peptidoglycan hydrolase CwlO-like protein